MKSPEEIRQLLLAGLTDDQITAVTSQQRKVLIVAGAGSGKTEVMARRVAWWIGIYGVDKNNIVAFTFTEKAAEEMKFRIRLWMERISNEGETVALGGMYIGTMHGFCLLKLREIWPDIYHNYDVIDEIGRAALIQRGFHGILGLGGFQNVLQVGQFDAANQFARAYDILHEYNLFEVQLAEGAPPINLGQPERDWCGQAHLITNVGESESAQAFALSAARYYAYMKCRRFLDFSTSQSEFIRQLVNDHEAIQQIQISITHLVVDEVQDVNPVQDQIIRTIIGQNGTLTAVGDHRQAIFAWRGGRVDIIARMWEEINESGDGEVIDLRNNFRSTQRLINLANLWANTIGQVRTMTTLEMDWGNQNRNDYDPSHLNVLRFNQRQEEANWITSTIQSFVNTQTGVSHDTRDGGTRGLALSDIVILLRSSTDARLYMRTLEANGIPAIFRAGPDLFSQPEVLLFIASLAITANIDIFFGADFNPRSLPSRIRATLRCNPQPREVLVAACTALRGAGLFLAEGLENRLIRACECISNRIHNGHSYREEEVNEFISSDIKRWLTNRRVMRRVFPQQLFHLLLSETGIEQWDEENSRGSSALFHLGALSGMVKGIETPGWTSTNDYRFQIIALLQFGSENGRTEEAPLLVPPNAVTISTVHGAKGLEFPVVFMADVCSRRFPSNFARRRVVFPFDGDILHQISIDDLSDNNNYDGERRLMYVALTRAERYLFITASGAQQSSFYRQLRGFVDDVGGTVDPNPNHAPENIVLLPTEYNRELRLTTSFSDLRYFLECPHDFYLRKVLGFTPTIDQAFGYGKGVHNLLRAIHSNPQEWAQLGAQGNELENAIQRLIDRGLFYLRYTTGDPAENMRQAGLRAVANYVRIYAEELQRLHFEPEKEFETLLEEEQVLISGAIDLVRLDDPPRVTLIDFKSGNAENENASGLDEEEMRLQISLYGHAAIHELEYDPERGLVRYLGETRENHRELEVNLNEETINAARQIAVNTARSIKQRQFFQGPQENHRCEHCDFNSFCGLEQARLFRANQNQ